MKKEIHDVEINFNEIVIEKYDIIVFIYQYYHNLISFNNDNEFYKHILYYYNIDIKNIIFK